MLWPVVKKSTTCGISDLGHQRDDYERGSISFRTAVLARKMLRRASFTSKQDLKQRIENGAGTRMRIEQLLRERYPDLARRWRRKS